MGKTWKDKNKWEKKQEGKTIKKTKKEHKYSTDNKQESQTNYHQISSFEWYEYEND
jgi:hypothetical protein